MPLIERTIFKNKAVITVLVCSMLLNVMDFSSGTYLFQEFHGNTDAIIAGVQGLALLVYPFLGWLADVHLTRFSALKCAPLVSAIGAIVGAISLCFLLQLDRPSFHLGYLGVISYAGITLIIAGKGLFEANALQFGLDQLMDSPSDHLSAFIHWYYWGIHFIQTLVFLPHIPIKLAQHNFLCNMENATAGDLYYHIKITSYAEFVLLSLGLFLSSCFTYKILARNRPLLTIQPVGVNPFKKVYQILKYTWKHKIPERRSAFTYWEDDVPARINVGKEKYGGPFSNEEVEDAKTSFRLLLVICTLFGFQMANNGFTTLKYLTKYGVCPSVPLFLMVGLNSNFLLHVAVTLGIPLYRLILLPILNYRIPRMLRKMWFGVAISVIQVSVYMTLSLIMRKHTLIDDQQSFLYCFFTQHNHSLSNSGLAMSVSDNVFIWMIIPQLIGGLSYMLVFVTTLEFLCAQAPRDMQGMFIGLWYSIGFIKSVGVDCFDSASLYFFPSVIPVLNILKVCASLVSLVMYSYVSRRYRYRERDEAVNFQAMIEDQYEWEIEQELLHGEQWSPQLLESYGSQRSNYGTLNTS